MVFILGGTPKCPHCGNHQFSSPRKTDPDEKITCISCGHVTTIKQALDAAISKPQARGSEDLVNKPFQK